MTIQNNMHLAIDSTRKPVRGATDIDRNVQDAVAREKAEHFLTKMSNYHPEVQVLVAKTLLDMCASKVQRTEVSYE
jgi:hypothetical protein